MVEEQHKVMLSYMKAMMAKYILLCALRELRYHGHSLSLSLSLSHTHRRTVFKKDKEREKAAKMIRDEAKKMSTLFLRLSHATNPKVSLLLCA